MIRSAPSLGRLLLSGDYVRRGCAACVRLHCLLAFWRPSHSSRPPSVDAFPVILGRERILGCSRPCSPPGACPVSRALANRSIQVLKLIKRPRALGGCFLTSVFVRISSGILDRSSSVGGVSRLSASGYTLMMHVVGRQDLLVFVHVGCYPWWPVRVVGTPLALITYFRR